MNKYLKQLRVFLLVFLVLVVLVWQPHSLFFQIKKVYGLTGYNYRQPINITHASQSGANYQLFFNVYKGEGSSSGNKTYLNNHCIDFPNDIRYVDDNETTLLDHWIEDSNSTWAGIWVEVADSLTTEDATIYVYYGKTGASSESDGDATFKLFDDFSSGLNTSKWTEENKGTGADVYVSGGECILDVPDDQVCSANLKSDSNYTNNIAVHVRRKCPSDDEYIDFTFAYGSLCDNNGGTSDWWLTSAHSGYNWCYQSGSSTGSNEIYEYPDSGARQAKTDDDVSLGSTVNSYAVWEYHYYYYYDYNYGYFEWIVDGVKQTSVEYDGTFVSADKFIMVTQGAYSGSGRGADTYIDWIFVRSCVKFPPTVDAYGSEEELDYTKPQYRNVDSNATSISENDAILLYGEGYDNYALDFAWLWTNETGGSGKNYTWMNTTDGKPFGHSFERYSNNPFDIPNGTGYGAVHPDVLYFSEGEDGYKYWMYYEYGVDETDCDVYLVRSNDGLNWVETGVSNPVITEADEKGHVPDPDVLKVGDTWYLYLMAGATGGDPSAFYRFTSSDGKSWSQNPSGSNPILELGSDESWDNDTIASPTVIYENGTYYMWYTGENSGTYQIGLATSSNGYNFTKDSDNPIFGPTAEWEGDEIWHTQLVKYDGVYWLYYIAGSPYKIGLAKSTDKENFTRSPYNPILEPQGAGWESTNLYRMSWLQDCTGNGTVQNDEMWFYYSARWTGHGYHIGLAFSWFKWEHYSPLNMNDTVASWIWSNFTWQNTSITTGITIQWRIYYNDTSGNINGTDTHTFLVYTPIDYFVDPEWQTSQSWTLLKQGNFNVVSSLTHTFQWTLEALMYKFYTVTLGWSLAESWSLLKTSVFNIADSWQLSQSWNLLKTCSFETVASWSNTFTWTVLKQATFNVVSSLGHTFQWMLDVTVAKFYQVTLSWATSETWTLLKQAMFNMLPQWNPTLSWSLLQQTVYNIPMTLTHSFQWSLEVILSHGATFTVDLAWSVSQGWTLLMQNVFNVLPSWGVSQSWTVLSQWTAQYELGWTVTQSWTLLRQATFNVASGWSSSMSWLIDVVHYVGAQTYTVDLVWSVPATVKSEWESDTFSDESKISGKWQVYVDTGNGWVRLEDYGS